MIKNSTQQNSLKLDYCKIIIEINFVAAFLLSGNNHLLFSIFFSFKQKLRHYCF